MMLSENNRCFPGTSTKRLIRKILEKYGISEISPQTMSAMLTAEGYRVIRFDPRQPSYETARLLEVLDLQEHAARENAFTYTDSTSRIVFVRSNISEEESLYLLAFELGRILTACHRDEAVLRLEPYEQVFVSDFALQILQLSEHGLARNSFSYRPFWTTLMAVSSVLMLFIAVFVFVISPRTGTETVFSDEKLSKNGNDAVAALSQSVTTPSDSSLTIEADGDAAKTDTDTVAASTDDTPPTETVTPPPTPNSDNQPAQPTVAAKGDANSTEIPDGFVIPPDERTYYATPSGTKYHLAGCSYLSGKDVRILTNADIQSGKYTPCSRCFGK